MSGTRTRCFWDAVRLMWPDPADCSSSLPGRPSMGSVWLHAVASRCHRLGEWFRSTEGTKCYHDWIWARALCQALWVEMTTTHFCLSSGMSLLRGGQGVPGWDKCSRRAGRSDGPVCSKAAQLEPYTGGEKSDSFFFPATCSDYYSEVRMKLWLHSYTRVLLACGQHPQMTCSSSNPLGGLRHIYAQSNPICLKGCGV